MVLVLVGAYDHTHYINLAYIASEKNVDELEVGILRWL